jgi:hypothetical protein
MTPVIHELKCALWSYRAVVCGDKRFEIRFNDRGYQRGDHIILRVYEEGCYDTQYAPVEFQITYVTNWNQKDGWCVLGIKEAGHE